MHYKKGLLLAWASAFSLWFAIAVAAIQPS
jgi:hypothetical protein